MLGYDAANALRALIQWLECLSDKQDVDGSIPSGTTKTWDVRPTVRTEG
jgi:bisphosphoglycerate-dependent phosphoglycerate mutase